MARSTHSRGAHAGARRARRTGSPAGEGPADEASADQDGVRPALARPHRGGDAGIKDADRQVRASAVSRLRGRPGTVRLMVVVVAAGLLAAIIGAGGFSPAPSAEPTVQAFLLAWQNKQYRKAAAMTTGAPAAVVVVRSLSVIFQQLDAAEDSLRMGPITQHGNSATAYFYASINLGRGGLPWTYRGHFSLRRAGSTWKVAWRPSVVVPGLGAGQRLAVLTTMPGRAPLLGATGRPLALRSEVYV